MSAPDARRRKRRLLAALSATLAHELSSPLSVAQLALDSAQQALDQAHRRRKALAMLGSTLAELQSVAALQPQNIRASLAELPLSGVSVEVPENMEVLATLGALDIVLGNLLDNARRHGGFPIDVRLSAERVSRPPALALVRFRPNAPMVLIKVTDAGPGIPDALRPRLFRLFSRGQRNGAGMGVGLWLSRRLARLHGGDLWLESSERGACFAVLWPAAEETPTASAAPEWPSDSKAFGLAVRAERERRGLTRAQVAELSGVCDSTWRNVETGRHRVTKVVRNRIIAYLKS